MEVNKKMRKELRTSIVFFACYLILQRFMALPDIFMGILMGLCISCLITGILPIKAYEVIINKKNKLKDRLKNTIKRETNIRRFYVYMFCE